jgi:clan AA aspartic protease
VQLEIESGDGGLEPIDTVVDTGFDGHLTLPSQVIAELGLEPDEPSDVVLATGSRERVNIWRGSVLWHDQIRRIFVLEANGVPLLGMELLEDSQLTLQARINGQVLIERLEVA